MLGMLEGSGYEKSGAGRLRRSTTSPRPCAASTPIAASILGDPDFVKIPIAGLLDPAYIQKRRATIDPNHATPSDQVNPGHPEGQREHGDHAFQRGRCGGQRGRGDLHAERRLRQRRHRARARIPAEQRNGRFRRQAGRAEYVRPGAGRSERHSARQAAALVDDADHPAARRQAVHGGGRARRVAHHHRGAAGDPQRGRFRHERAGCGGLRRASIINGSRTSCIWNKRHFARHRRAARRHGT